jgi:riboflavin kinase/FMN adenylyltransferase
VEIVRLETLEPRAWVRPAVTVGNFDGVHRGHQALVAAALDAARADAGTAIVLTYDPHPAHVLAPHRAPAALMTVAQKAEVLAGLGIERLAVLPFTAAVAGLSAAEFARSVLAQAVGARTIVVGDNFRFGHNREGDVSALSRLGETLAFRVATIAPVLHDGAPVSSTRIREALSRGAVEAAREMLGRPYFVDGVVRRGAGRGRTIGFPTANLEPMNETVPGGGVYAGFCRELDDPGSPRRPAVVNVGRRPTFGGGGELLIEAHLFDFTGDLYDRRLRLSLVHHLRDERAFPGVDALKAQIALDAAEARRWLAKEP